MNAPTHATTEDVQLVFNAVADLTQERGLDLPDLMLHINLPEEVVKDALTKLAGIVIRDFGTHTRGPVYRLKGSKRV